MGLDMTLLGRKVPAERFEDGYSVHAVEIELAYWRKHADLHGFIVNTFENGVDECQQVALSVEDIDTIIRAVKNNKLPETSGFFFRYEGYDPKELAEDDVKVLEAAREWADTKVEGEWRYLVYQASW